jgi:hypothetical protein
VFVQRKQDTQDDVFFLQNETLFIAYKSSTTQDPPRPLPGAEVRNMFITGNHK